MTILSPLTHRPNVTLVKTIDVAGIVAAWQKEFNIDPSKEFSGNETIYLYRCNETGLEFFWPPDLAGSSELYEKLEKLDWYYMEAKQEHEWAEEDVRNCHHVLEVGCARGYFVDRLRNMSIDAVGIELNESACKIAVDRNLPVFQMDLSELASEIAIAFDGVCAFQVLEHVPEPRKFLAVLIDMLAPGGLLVLSVPNSESFLRHAKDNPLNSPPHHVTRWNVRAFRFLERIFPIKIVRIKYEALAQYHVDWYMAVMTSGRTCCSRRLIANHWTRRMLESSLVRRLIRGHTIYVCFRKI